MVKQNSTRHLIKIFISRIRAVLRFDRFLHNIVSVGSKLPAHMFKMAQELFLISHFHSVNIKEHLF